MGLRVSALLLLAFVVACGDDDGGADAGPCAGSCDDGVFCDGVETCSPTTGCMPGTPPCGDDRCIETSESCEPACTTPDGDGDGFDDIACDGADCDDTNPSVFPGATEICDAAGVDEDCDPATLGGIDRDGDGAIDVACCNGSECGGDCDDYRADRRPGATEVCNGWDDDCDGNVDEGVAIDGFADTDGDLYGDPDAPIRGCAGWAGISSSDLDCDDDSPVVHGAQPEVTDGLDNDCDGRVDEEPTAQPWYLDADGDGFGDPDAATMSSDAPIAGYALLGADCDDDDEARNPGEAERCNGVDDDCDPRTVFALGATDGEDDDGDGYPDARCPGVAPAAADCDDRDADVRPNAAERCNDQDDDCDGVVDESCTDPPPCDGSCGAPEDVIENCGCSAGFACFVESGAYDCRAEGAAGAGESCATAADCAGGHQCHRGLCYEICDSIDDVCPGDRWCTRNLAIEAIRGLPDTLGVCTIACDPIADTGCGTDTCRIAATAPAYFPFCDEVGNVPLGDPCSISPDCVAGGVCEPFSVGAPRECLAVCPSICPSGFECNESISTLADGTPFQFCRPL